MKTRDIIFINNLLSGSDVRLSKIEDDNKKFDIILLLADIKQIADRFQDLVESARIKLIDKDYESNRQKLNEWRMNGDDSISDEDKAALNEYFTKAQKTFENFIHNEEDKEVDIDITAIKENVKDIILSNNFALSDSSRLINITK